MFPSLRSQNAALTRLGLLQQTSPLCTLFSSSQLRSIPVKNAEDDELEEEADWIYRNAFAMPTISLQVRICLE